MVELPLTQRFVRSSWPKGPASISYGSWLAFRSQLLGRLSFRTCDKRPRAGCNDSRPGSTGTCRDRPDGRGRTRKCGLAHAGGPPPLPGAVGRGLAFFWQGPSAIGRRSSFGTPWSPRALAPLGLLPSALPVSSHQMATERYRCGTERSTGSLRPPPSPDPPLVPRVRCLVTRPFRPSCRCENRIRANKDDRRWCNADRGIEFAALPAMWPSPSDSNRRAPWVDKRILDSFGITLLSLRSWRCASATSWGQLPRRVCWFRAASLR